jgi:hypothetical protein
MIQSLRIENPQGESILCEFAKPWDTGFLLTELEGMGPVKADIQTTSVNSADGSRFNSARMDERNIVAHIMFYETDEFTSIEDLRHKTYQYFPSKQKVKLTMTTDNRQLWIEGYIESNDPDIWSDQETAEISIICPDPFFREVGESKWIFNGIDPLFEFPFHSDQYEEYTPGFEFPFESGEDVYVLAEVASDSLQYDEALQALLEKAGNVRWDSTHLRVYHTSVGWKLAELADEIEFGLWNDPDGVDQHWIEFGSINLYSTMNVKYTGDEPTGASMHFHAIGNDLTNIRVYNETYRQIFKINTDQIEIIMKAATKQPDDDPETFYGFRKGDDIYIETDAGYKSAMLLRDGIYYNILNSVAAIDNDWTKIFKGKNKITYITDGVQENLEFEFSYKNKYWGI